MFKLKTALLALVILLGVFTSSQSAIVGEAKMEAFGDFVSHLLDVDRTSFGYYANLIADYHFSDDDKKASDLQSLVYSNLITQGMVVGLPQEQKTKLSEATKLVKASLDALKEKKGEEFFTKLDAAGDIIRKSVPNLKINIQWTV